ncbi:helix-turn-helix domain-containing protein [Microvirga sesbaniae]|uniref:helix-turn-helix domain-containing protein n=1 Tax=Microvirga sesbaniae TaxID=681392 RepID=UPI0021C9A1C3|nr:helix-turn-helix domain-containing protein [Microvirga sp. HBU67692]
MEEIPASRRLRVATFTASEVEKITGVTSAMQRDWRRRELIDTSPGRGWKRLGTEELVQVLVMRVLSERNIPPGFARKLGRMAILPVLERLLAEAYPGEDIELMETTAAFGTVASILDQAEQAVPAEEKLLVVGPFAGDLYTTPLRQDENRYLIYAETKEPSGYISYSMERAASIESFKLSNAAQRKKLKRPAADRFFVFVVVDILDIFAEMIDRRIKPYFIEIEEEGQANES